MYARLLLLIAALIAPLSAFAGDPSPQAAIRLSRAGAGIGGAGLATSTIALGGSLAGCYGCAVPAAIGNVAFLSGDLLLLGGTTRAATLLERRGAPITKEHSNAAWVLWGAAQGAGLVQLAMENAPAAYIGFGIAGQTLSVSSYALGLVQLRRNDTAYAALASRGRVEADAPDAAESAAPRPFVQVAPSFVGGRVGLVVGGTF